MTRLLITLSAATAAIGAFVALPSSAAAQQPQGTIGEIIVYGNDPCPRSTDDQVVVCARRPEAERYRLAPKLRPSGTRQEMQSWGVRSRSLETVGATGTGSCSPVGPGGFTGCMIQSINQARQQRRETVEGNTPPEQ